MFCYQCQEASKNTGCITTGVCGKKESTSDLQDLLVYVLKGIAVYAERLRKDGNIDKEIGRFTVSALFATITNANFDDERMVELIKEGLKLREDLREKSGISAEAMTIRILEELVKACSPRWMQVESEMNPRGGIGLTVLVDYGTDDPE